ncbi:hypothetical protein [Trujillonella humicola]|uniref:hypothetical protein n=1 Tax=Trujillonella humicola TaxID=3383699 RepID=UPI0039067FA9
MTEQHPPYGTTPAPGPHPAAGWPAPSEWTPAPAPAPVPASGGGPAPAAGGWRRRPVLTALAVAAVAVLGTAAAAATATALVLWRADDVGERIGAGAGEALGRAQIEATERMYELDQEYFSEESYGWSAYGPGEVEQFPPVPPGELGADPQLDRYAQECFDGDLDSCDDLYAESPPLSAYEEYASTCGGRVKTYSMPLCTELG